MELKCRILQGNISAVVTSAGRVLHYTYLLIQRFGAGQYIKDLDQVNEKVVVKEAAFGASDERYEVFSVGSKKAFLFVVVHYFLGETGEAAVSMTRLKWSETLRRIVRKLFSRAVRNPIRFRRRL